MTIGFCQFLLTLSGRCVACCFCE